MPRPNLTDRLIAHHAERTAADLARRLRTVTAATGLRIRLDGRDLLSFASNDYLGLAQDPRLIAALQSTANDFGVGATAAHLLGGHRRPHQQLEASLAEWLGYPRALLFSTGMMANIGVLSCLLQRGDVCVQDRLNHASLIDGARLAGAELLRYPHADLAAARRQLQARPQAAALLASDAVFSMDGDRAALGELAALCQREPATLLVDDAHGLGVLGEQGRGSVAAQGLSATEVPVLMVTLGKALGTFGAAVLGSTALIEGLIQFSRPYIYTTALPPALAAATLQSISIVRAETWRRDHLAVLIERFRSRAQAIGLRLMASATPIQPILIGDSGRAMAWSQQLEAAGFYVPAIRPPTVPDNAARLRVTLSASHSLAEVDALIEALARASAA